MIYKITGGTGKWADASGTGGALITDVLPYRGILTITFTADSAVIVPAVSSATSASGAIAANPDTHELVV